MTRRDYLEAKVAKREEWAAGRRAKAAGLLKRNEPYVGDHAFNTQPGHIPERARVIAREDKAFEHGQMAAHHDAKASGLAAQLETTIFSDDLDAVEALHAKIAGLEAERDRAKAVNAAVRKAKKKTADPAACLAGLVADGVLTKDEGMELARSYALQPYHGLGFPAYHLTNLGANIRRLKGRIEEVKRRQVRTAEAEAAPGGVVITNITAESVTVVFAEKPARAVLDALKAAGFFWSGGTWCGQRAKVPEIVIEMTKPKEVQDGP